MLAVASGCVWGVELLHLKNRHAFLTGAHSWSDEHNDYWCDGCVDRIRNMD